MTRLMMAAAALALLGAPAAFAQDSSQTSQSSQSSQSGQWQGRPQPGQWQGRQGGQSGQSGQGQGGRPAGGQWQGRPGGAQPGAQTSQRPNWDAYLKNNPDLQRAYRQNQQNPNYHESPDAFAQRHYQEHGKTEGRSVPMQSYQPNTSQGDRRGGTPQGRGDRNSWQGRGDLRDRGDRWQGSGDRDRWQDWRREQRFRNYERNVWAQRRYRAREYYWPRGWSYRRFAFGQFLPQVFFSQDYWIYDYSSYGLPYAPPGTVWVRYGPDALLIDEDTGEIIQVVYGLFY